MSSEKIRTRDATPEYRSGWEALWGKKAKRAEKRAKDKDGPGAKFCWDCGTKHFLEDACV